MILNDKTLIFQDNLNLILKLKYHIRVNLWFIEKTNVSDNYICQIILYYVFDLFFIPLENNVRANIIETQYINFIIKYDNCNSNCYDGGFQSFVLFINYLHILVIVEKFRLENIKS